MLIDICIKFHEYSLRGFQVIERTRFVTDRQTDRQTDARGKTICLPTLKGGDINIQLKERTSFQMVNFHKQRAITTEGMVGYGPLTYLKKTSRY